VISPFNAVVELFPGIGAAVFPTAWPMIIAAAWLRIEPDWARGNSVQLRYKPQLQHMFEAKFYNMLFHARLTEQYWG
jgi:hypothetical protein